MELGEVFSQNCLCADGCYRPVNCEEVVEVGEEVAAAPLTGAQKRIVRLYKGLVRSRNLLDRVAVGMEKADWDNHLARGWIVSKATRRVQSAWDRFLRAAGKNLRFAEVTLKEVIGQDFLAAIA